METSNNKSANQILLEAASLLEEEGKWNKGDFFKPLLDRPGCAMCAHGAIAYCGNPEVKIETDRKEVEEAEQEAATAMEAARRAQSAQDYWKRYYSNCASQEGLSLEEWVAKHYGQTGLAHYKAIKVGLTTGYNDAPGTSQQNVVRKLREAATQTL